jgi:hypothetical protein
MSKFSLSLLLTPVALGVAALTACGGSSGDVAVAPLSDQNINLIFVLSPDLTYAASGDVNPVTSNLTNQGLNRSLKMASYLKQQVLGGKNVTGIYALAPMTHLQTANNLPDMASLGAIQQFAMLNQITLPTFALPPPAKPVMANSFPINVAYAAGMVLPTGVVAPFAPLPCPACQGLDFSNSGGSNDALISRIVSAKTSGYHVFSAPWETASAMLTNINKRYGSSLTMPSGYAGPNQVYAVSITPSGSASLVTYNSNLTPETVAPVLTAALPKTACNAQPQQFSFSIKAGQPYSQTLNGVTSTGTVNAILPKGISTNQTIYMIRHAEAHPSPYFDDGNYIAAGQWRALGLADALRGKISPDMVMSIDPAQVAGALLPDGTLLPNTYTYVRTDMTVEPYAISNNLPFYLVSSLSLMDVYYQGSQNIALSSSVVDATNYFFIGSKYANKKILLAWEHDHIPPTLNDLFSRYFPGGVGGPLAANFPWPDTDYDTVWTVKLDAQGNLTADNALCEGIDSSILQAKFSAAPQF